MRRAETGMIHGPHGLHIGRHKSALGPRLAKPCLWGPTSFVAPVISLLRAWNDYGQAPDR